ncbi:MAG: hypothetical protein C5B55_14865 [Blastocatellia bacterium]|nr:MAG: hypothetical protein C5B55_14865 [Blastocatellia bacterium]
MTFGSKSLHTTILCLSAAFIFGGSSIRAQNSVAANQPKPAISLLDTTKEQDGLIGSIRRVKTESAKIEWKDGRQVEGPLQLLELTTYGIKGNRLENISYPTGDSQAGKEEYKYDDKGNIIEMTLRNDQGNILSREAYSYTFDSIGNWTKMVTSLVVFEDGQLKREPVEITYRTLTYYFDDSIATLTKTAPAKVMPNAPAPVEVELKPDPTIKGETSQVTASEVAPTSLNPTGDPPVLTLKREEQPKVRPESRQPNNESSNDLGPKLKTGRKGANSESDATLRSNPIAESEERPRSVAVSATRNDSATPPSVAEVERVVNGKTALDYYQAGLAHFELGDFEAAVNDYLSSIQIDQRSALVFLNLGNAYLKLSKDKDALKAFQQSVKLNPDNAEAQYGLGLTSFRVKHFREAATAYKNAIKQEPNMAKAHYGLALAYEELSEHSAMVSEFRILEKLDKNLAKKLAQTFPQTDFSCRFTMLCQ